jgi:16S rRNA (guanine966-N2)-methyltransferase
MRITGGIYRGRTIICPPGEIRPAMDRMRESVFAVLGDLTGCSFLDLFAGSGVIGIEAASRGAGPVVLVEMDRRKIGVLKQNVSFVTGPIEIKLSDAERYLKKCGRAFDYIFLDPPFRYPAKAALFSLIAEYGVFSGKGRILLHLPRAEDRGLAVEEFKRVDERHYGGSHVVFFERR